MRPRGVSGLRRAFVGRDGELELLQAAYERVVRAASRAAGHDPRRRGRGQDAARPRALGPARRGVARAAPSDRPLPPYGHGITYWPLGEC